MQKYEYKDALCSRMHRRGRGGMEAEGMLLSLNYKQDYRKESASTTTTNKPAKKSHMHEPKSNTSSMQLPFIAEALVTDLDSSCASCMRIACSSESKPPLG